MTTTTQDRLDKLCGRARYAADVALPGMLHARVLRSPHAHARLVGIDAAAALAWPGVVAVLTAADLSGTDPYFGRVVQDQPLLAIGKVRHVGDAVALVIAEDESVAVRALEQVQVDYTALPAVADVQAALAPGAPLLFEERQPAAPPAFDAFMSGTVEPGGNLLYRFEYGFGDVDAAFAACASVHDDVFHFSRMTHYHLEPLVTVARPVGDRGFELWSNNQDPFELRTDLARIFRRDEADFRIHTPTIGGGFGGKSHCKSEPLAVLAARHCGRPVRLAIGMSEAMLSLSQHPARLRLRTGVAADGRLLVRESEVLLDGGAYADASIEVANQLGFCMPGPYRWQAVKTTVLALRTNTVPSGSFRGFGRTQATWASESQVDMIARRQGVDPVACRRHNLLARGQMFRPGDTPMDCDLAPGLDAVLAALQPASMAGWRCGTGVAIGFKSAGLHGRGAQARVELQPDGTAQVHTGLSEIGQGARTMAARIAARVLGIPADQVRVLDSDTRLTPPDPGTHACTGVVLSGSAIHAAALSARQQQEDTGAADGLGTFQAPRVAGTPFGTRALYWQPAWAAARVAVDNETGIVRVLSLVVASDAGCAIDLQACHGQNLGGALQGLAQALFEELQFDEARPLNADPRRYRVPLASDLPAHFQSLVFESGGGPGPWGAKGIGEATIMAVPAALANAIADAVGVRLQALPMHPQRLLDALWADEPITAVPTAAAEAEAAGLQQ